MIDLHHLPGSSLEESNIQVFRRHWFTLFWWALSLIGVFLLPVGAYFAFQIQQPEIFETPANFAVFMMGVSVFFLFGLLFVFQTFMEYWLDVFIVTDKRILDIDQTGLFKRTISELRLYRTQDVTSEVKGFFNSILDYGDIYVQTAGEMERFHFEDVPRPNAVAKMILELAEKDRSEHLEEAVEEFGMPDKPHSHKEGPSIRKVA